MRIGLWALCGLIGLYALLAAADLYGGRLIDREAAGIRVALRRAAGPAAPVTETTLPAPAARYLNRAAPVGLPRPARVLIHQTGRLRLPRTDAFFDLSAAANYTTNPPGFVWRADISLAPGVTIKALDYLIDGRAGRRGKFVGLFELAGAAGPETVVSSLLRYLADAVWFPQALRPRPGLTWTAAGQNSALVTLSAAGRRVSGKFTFDELGRVISFVTDDRFRNVDGRPVRTPWRVRYSEHSEVSGEEIPLAAEASWLLPEGERVYLRLKLEDIAIAE